MCSQKLFLAHTHWHIHIGRWVSAHTHWPTCMCREQFLRTRSALGTYKLADGSRHIHIDQRVSAKSRTCSQKLFSAHTRWSIHTRWPMCMCRDPSANLYVPRAERVLRNCSRHIHVGQYIHDGQCVCAETHPPMRMCQCVCAKNSFCEQVLLCANKPYICRCVCAQNMFFSCQRALHLPMCRCREQVLRTASALRKQALHVQMCMCPEHVLLLSRSPAVADE